MTPSFTAQLDQTTALIAALKAQSGPIEAIAQSIATAVLSGHTLFTCGNGGSAADAGHFAEELSGRYRSNRRALPAQSLSIDALAITCIANDFGYDVVFARQIEALGRPGDVLCALSTSGNSPSILAAIDAANAKGMTTVALLGKNGGHARGRANYEVIIPSHDSGRIQEMHMQIIHFVCEVIETQCQ